jgi:hypothetical protein
VTGHFLRVRALLVLLATLPFSACSSQDAPKAPEPETVLQAIPAADAAQYGRVVDMKNWRNPYLIIRADGVVLFDAANNAEITLKTEEVLPALSRLPASNWPYGRVVAAAENGVRATGQDGVAIRRNRGIVGGTLAAAHVAIRWVSAE